MKFKNRIKGWILKKVAQRNYIEEINPQKIKKILIIREGGIGDAVCNYPLLRELKKAYPHYEIDVYAGLSNNFMYTYVPYVRNVYTKYKKRQWLKTWIDLFKMRNNQYDLIIDNTTLRFNRVIYTIFINAKWVLASLGEKETYNLTRESLSLYYGIYKTNKLEHIIDMRLGVLKFLNIKNLDNTIEFHLSKDRNIQFKPFIDALQGKFLIGLNTDGTHPSRTLNQHQIITFCKALKRDDIKVILFSLPHKQEYFSTLIKNEKLSNVTLTYPTKTIYDASEIISSLDILITPDTSFVHIASGLNTPIIGLFWNNPIKTVVWGPKSKLFKIITPNALDKDINTIANINIQEAAEATFQLLKDVQGKTCKKQSFK